MSGLQPFLGAALGGLIGFIYYRVVGCRSGACPLTSKWWTAVAYGAVMGAVFAR